MTLPLSYIEFAKEETHLFKLLFINEKKVKIFSKTTGINLENAKLIDFRTLSQQWLLA